MSLAIKNYDQYFFDCDGVLLNSNHVKSEAFFLVAKRFSPELAQDFLNYHKTYGGISRFEKFRYFFETMMKLSDYQQELNQALKHFKDLCVEGLLDCEVVPGIKEFLSSLEDTKKKFVVSGGVEEEVIAALLHKNMSSFFHGIYGSPATKNEIMEKICTPGLNSVFFGDAKLDYEISQKFKCDFVFISGQTEFEDYETFFANKPCPIHKNFLGL